MGCIQSKEIELELVELAASRQSRQKDWLSDMASRRIVQLMDTTSGMVIGPSAGWT